MRAGHILRRRWLAGVLMFSFSAAGGVPLALFKPLQYEAVIGIEKRPAQISLQPMAAEYDVTRYTSEDERTIAVLKSRYMLLEWLKAIGIPWSTPRELERQLKKLDKRFIVKPVNFTDLYMLRVRAGTPEEAKRRLELIVGLFQRWDAEQAAGESEEVIRLLKKRLEAVKTDLADKRDLVKRLKLARTISLSGSTSESELDTEIKARQNLFDGLTDELEKAERGMDPLSVHRVRMVIPLTGSEKPLYARWEYLLIVLSACAMLSLAAMVFRERRTLTSIDIHSPKRSIDLWPSGLKN